MMDTMRAQNDAMKRSQDQQAANNAQIMTSKPFLAYALKNQLRDNKGAPAEDTQEFE